MCVQDCIPVLQRISAIEELLSEFEKKIQSVNPNLNVEDVIQAYLKVQVDHADDFIIS